MALSVSAAILAAGLGVCGVLGGAPAAPAGLMAVSAPVVAPVAVAGFTTDRWDFRCDRWHGWDDRGDDRCFRHDDWHHWDGWHDGDGWRR